MTNATRSTEQGFTLVELMVVIVVLGVLAAIVTFAAGPMLSEAHDAKTREDTRTCAQAQTLADGFNQIHVDQRTANDYVDGGTGC